MRRRAEILGMCALTARGTGEFDCNKHSRSMPEEIE